MSFLPPKPSEYATLAINLTKTVLVYEHALWLFQYINHRKLASFFPCSFFLSELNMLHAKHCS